MKCSICNETAILSQRYSSMHFCEDHFIEDFENKVEKTIRDYAMVKENDRIAVAVSGGKDSTALLCVLSKILRTGGWRYLPLR